MATSSGFLPGSTVALSAIRESNPRSSKAVESRVALVNSPFASVQTPSIQLGLIKSLCAIDGIEVDDKYLNVRFAAALGLHMYHSFCFVPSPDIGEWIFGHAAFGDDIPPEAYLRDFTDDVARFARDAGIPVSRLVELRQETVPDLVEAAATDLARYPVVGFTSTFQQNVSALALARAVKRKRPGVKIVMGGSNYHGSMGREFFRAFDWIDYVVTGEADHFIAKFFAALLNDQELPAIAGILSRFSTEDPNRARDPIYLGSMDDLPLPDYDGYFETLKEVGLDPGELNHPVSMPFETSRGCWWGAKHHCTFCGLNSVGMAFRAKSPERAAEDIKKLVDRHAITRLDATDNIVEHKRFGELMQTIKELELPLNLFYEIKSNVSREDVRKMRAAGVRRVQPGIESFSTHVLKLMSKGVSALQNINAIRWLTAYGVDPLWNVLYGFPGETAADYDEQARLIPWLTHLPPPQVVTRINLDRFSPNLERPELREQFSEIQPFASYAYIYPREVDLELASYHFVGTPRDAPQPDEYASFFKALRYWKQCWKHDELTPFSAWPIDRPILSLTEGPEGTAVVTDSRRKMSQPNRITLAGVEYRAMKAFFERPRAIERVKDAMVRSGDSLADVGRAIDDLANLKLIYIEDGSALALPIPETCGLEEPVQAPAVETQSSIRAEPVLVK